MESTTKNKKKNPYSFLLKNISTTGELAEALSKLPSDTPLTISGEEIGLALVQNNETGDVLIDEYDWFFEAECFDENEYEDYIERANKAVA